MSSSRYSPFAGMSLEELISKRNELRAKLSNLAARGQSAQGRAKDREFTEAEQRQIDNWFSEFTDCEAQIKALDAEIEDIQSYAADAAGPPGRQVPPMKPNDLGLGYYGAGHDDAPLTGSPKFFDMFPQARAAAQSRSGFANLGEFARAVYQRDPRLFDIRNASGASEGVGADGGFFISVQQFAGLMDASLQQEAVRPGATIIPMTSSTVVLPMFDMADRSTGIAGVEGKLTAEGATGTTQKFKAREVTLNAKKISVLIPATQEILMDAPAVFAQLLQQHMTDALGQTLDTWFLGPSGTGAGCPLSILNAPCTVSVAKDASQPNTTLTATNLASMVSRLSAGSWSRATWIVSPSALAQLFTMTVKIQNAAASDFVGGSVPNWFTTNPDGSFTLLGRPLIVSDRMQALGTKGDILLADLRSYIIGVRQNAELLVDTSIGFKESEIWFRLNCRIDGQPSLNTPITPRVGSATLSPFVTLDGRP